MHSPENKDLIFFSFRNMILNKKYSYIQLNNFELLKYDSWNWDFIYDPMIHFTAQKTYKRAVVAGAVLQIALLFNK